MNEKYAKEMEPLCPHSPDVIERETSDGGFSRGWGMHFQPVENYWINVHTHVRFDEKDKETLENCLKFYFGQAGLLNVKSAVIIPPSIERLQEFGSKSLTGLQYLNCYLDAVKKNNAMINMLYLSYKNPDAKLVEEAVKLGIRGVKLHNAPVITDGSSPEIWLSKEWKEVFGVIGKYKLPVLWHVTQRLTDSPYTGGGRNTYWKEGWEKGVRFTNEDLLQVFLKIVGEFTGINFIAAHQLHLGWERLTGLFDRFENLYSDTTVGCRVGRYDEMYAHDRKYLRDIFIRYGDRVLFGTDGEVYDNMPVWEIELDYCDHIRFIKQLQLPYDILQKVAHGNTERLFNLY